MRIQTLVGGLLIAAAALSGCGGGGGGGGTAIPTVPTPAPTPDLQVLPASFDFGKVTGTNTPAPLEVTIKNTGTALMRVFNIGLTSGAYALDVAGGSRPCGSPAPTVAVNDSCTVQVRFQPSSTGTFSSTLQVSSDGGSSSVPISGTSEAIATLTVRVNQIDTAVCPDTSAYVSVIDQGGFPVLGLLAPNFTVTQGGANKTVISASYIDVAYRPIAIAAVLDHSGSLTDQTEAFADMTAGFSALLNNVRSGDLGEIIKFDNEVEVVQPFTSDKALLLAAVAAPFDKGRFTRLYDALFLAVDNTAVHTSSRRAVVVATDGTDEGPTAGVPYSTHTLAEVIANAVSKKVPVFAVGIGPAVNQAVLQQLADGTGGLFYQAATSENLATIYQQLSSILQERQYVVRFDQTVFGTTGTASTVTVAATTPLGVTGSGSANLLSCN